VINTLHTITASTKGLGQDSSPLAQQIAKRADANHDGAVSSEEFSIFMQELLARLDAPADQPTGAAANAPVEATSFSAVPLVGVVSLNSLTPVGK
jgi:hypothetical protein